MSLPVAIGFDLTVVGRYQDFYRYSDRQLERIFSKQEIQYCRSDAQKCAQRFAVRFAAKEAFYKAISSLFENSSTAKKRPFFLVCRSFSLVAGVGCSAYVDWDVLKISPCSVLVSVSHEKDMAGAVVILQRI